MSNIEWRFLLPSLNSTMRGTAVITGASSGIGRTYAEKLAKRGYDLVLVARREDRLKQIAESLQTEFSIAAKVLVADLSEAAGVAVVSEHIAKSESISILVNNAGISAVTPLTETPDETIAAMIHLNIIAVTALSKAALLNFKSKGSGTIINIGSGVGFSPFSAVPIYSATKAYVYLLTQNLQGEVAGTDIRVQVVMPGAVKSEGWDRAVEAGMNSVPEEIVMSTSDCVDASLSGLDLGEVVTAPSLENISALQDYERAASMLVQSMFNGTPATRYSVGKTA